MSETSHSWDDIDWTALDTLAQTAYGPGAHGKKPVMLPTSGTFSSR